MPTPGKDTSSQPAGESNHGLTGYRRGCHCPTCRAANTRKYKRLKAAREARRDTADFEHGASAYNNWRCRCPICTQAHTQAVAPRDQALKDRHPADPAIHRQPWTPEELAIIARTDIPATWMAELTGRSYTAVIHRRRRLRQDTA